MKRKRLVFVLAGFLALVGCFAGKPPAEATVELESICLDDSMLFGPLMSPDGRFLYFNDNGKYLYEVDLENNDGPRLVLTIDEAVGYYVHRYGQTFLQEMKWGPDGLMYAVSENCILRIDPEIWTYEKIVDDGFSGPWGAFGLDIDEEGNLYVGDHYGGVHFFDKSNSWEKTTLLDCWDSIGAQATFGGVVLSPDDKMLYCQDFMNSLLLVCRLDHSGDVPTIKTMETLELPIAYPEFSMFWKNDLFIKSARENKMIRVRNGEIIQTITFVCSEDPPAGNISYFRLVPQDKDTALFYGASWNAQEGIYVGEVTF